MTLELVSESTAITTDQANQLIHFQKTILEKVALGHEHDYQLILDQLCKSTEALIPNAVASIMLFDETHSHLQVISAPSLPDDAINALNGLIPGQFAGSCGTAVYSNEPQFVFNTHSDLRWKNFQQFVIDFSVGACWSMPIRINEQKAIGSFAISSFEERRPTSFFVHLQETSASIAGVIIKRQQEQKQLWKMAHYDSLTGLPNRTLFHVRLRQALDNIDNSSNQLAILFLDLDNFKTINDTQGHTIGDEVLKLVSKQIKQCLRPNDSFARLGGDEFVILIETFKDIETLSSICRKILNQVSSCKEIMNFSITTSIGVCIAPDHGKNIDILLRNADTAMYKAKASGLSRFHIYQQQLTQEALNKLELSQLMYRALLNKEFIIHYQAQFDSNSKHILGVEALVRWQHESKGLIPPTEFIPIAEENGLINELGWFVISQACQDCLTWWQSGLKKFNLAINVSVKQLEIGFSDKLLALIRDIDFPLSNLELEVTESKMMQKSDLDELIKLSHMGFMIVMDDFGTGQSSLSQLKRLPINKLKIDRSFVQDIPDDPEDIIMSKTIIAMAHSLGLSVVAEGVETKAQNDFLAQHQCDQIQGFLLSKPLSANQFRKFLSANQ